jgi:hypothetical protein
VGAHGYPKTEADYGKLGKYVNRARRSGLIDWDAIRDDSNIVPEEPGWDGTDQFWVTVKFMAKDYGLTPRGDAYIELWVEAAGTVPQIASVADDFGVRVIGTGGFSSVTARRDAALRLEEMAERMGPGDAVVLLIGDHDPSGASIMDSSASDLLAFSRERTPSFERLAVTQEQAEEYELESAPQKSTDRRGEYMAETYQAEALDPADLAEIVRTRRSELIPDEVLEETRTRGDAERAVLLEIIEEIQER